MLQLRDTTRTSGRYLTAGEQSASIPSAYCPVEVPTSYHLAYIIVTSS